jgi:hypothetical protein
MAQFNPADKITLDVPLFIRLLEYAREDAKTDMDLHKITENAVALSETGKTLTMAQYDSIVKDSDGEDKPSVINQLDRAKLQPAQNQMNENKNKHMKTQLNEIKRMQQLAGLLKENNNQSTNKYIDITTENGEEFPILNKELITTYLKSVIDPEEIENVDIFMNDDEGYGESSMYFFDTPEETPQASEQDVEDWAKQEMSYYLFSKPDEFPSK